MEAGRRRCPGDNLQRGAKPVDPSMVLGWDQGLWSLRVVWCHPPVGALFHEQMSLSLMHMDV